MIPTQPRGGRGEDRMLPLQDERGCSIEAGKRGAGARARLACAIEAGKRLGRPQPMTAC